jgi:hypothetical protein
MPEDQLLQRADKAIAESERLIDELRRSRFQAEQLGDSNYLDWLRIEELVSKRLFAPIQPDARRIARPA